MAASQYSAGEDRNPGCLLAVVIGVVLLIAIAVGNGSGSSTANLASSAGTNENMPAAKSTPAAPDPLDRSAVSKGLQQFRLVAAAHVPGSSEILVQNCYEAFGKLVDWHQLDRCGGYDAAAVRWTEANESSAGGDDLNYFQSEAAATRYLSAATGAGLPADQADERWGAIQAMASKVRVPKAAAPEPEAAPMDGDTIDTGEEVADPYGADVSADNSGE